jgi:trimeric autotransporter adhesin
MKLRPVVYNFQTKKYDEFIGARDTNDEKGIPDTEYAVSERIRHTGFIAQEVERAAKETGYEFDGVVVPNGNKETYGLAYSQFVVPLVKGMQEQQRMIERLNKENEELKKRLEKLEALIK